MSPAKPLIARVQGLALIGPGLPGWAASQALLRGDAPHVGAPTVLPPVQSLPPAERRRAGASIRLGIVAAEAACSHAGADPKQLATVFAESHGDGANCHALCEMLAGGDRLISPTRFTQSVHNATAGYWHIATGAMTASTSIAAYNASFAAGLLEAMTQLTASGEPVLLVACDAPQPEPLHSAQPITDLVAIALVLMPDSAGGGLARLRMSPSDAAATRCRDAGLEALRLDAPAARGLPLLAAIAAADRAASVVVLPWLDGVGLAVDVRAAEDHAR